MVVCPPGGTDYTRSVPVELRLEIRQTKGVNLTVSFTFTEGELEMPLGRFLRIMFASLLLIVAMVAMRLIIEGRIVAGIVGIALVVANIAINWRDPCLASDQNK